jgi:cellulose synthase/poly-beta-1,6-N-acetylglucosamine synthase-like glycosyltransferase
MYLELLIVISLFIWLILLTLWGNFWLSNQRLETQMGKLDFYPRICAIVPARNEAMVIESSLKSLLEQDYPGLFQIILVDDQSQDETATLGENLAKNLNQQQRLTIISGQPLPVG